MTSEDTHTNEMHIPQRILFYSLIQQLDSASTHDQMHAR